MTFDPTHDKLHDQPVTIGGDKSAAAWHPNSGSDVPRAVYESLVEQRDRYVRRYMALVDVELERDEARAERDALAHVIDAHAPHWQSCASEVWDHGDFTGSSGEPCDCYLSEVPAVSLALHDAEVKAQALDDAGEWLLGMVSGYTHESGQIRAGRTIIARIKDRAAAIREEAGS